MRSSGLNICIDDHDVRYHKGGICFCQGCRYILLIMMNILDVNSR